LTANYITLNLCFNALLAPQLASSERWVTAFIDQLEHYLAINKRYPTTIVFDLTCNENNSNVESLYSTLENIKNGRLYSTFYGRFKRLRFKSPYLIVFTNNVPNMSALSSDRFNLLAITDKINNSAIVKCEVNLEIDNYTNSLVTWYYKARVSYDKDQESFYKKILEGADMVQVDISALITEGAHLNNRQFDVDRRARTHAMAPEPVQQYYTK